MDRAAPELDETPGERVMRFRFLREEIRHEDNLIAQRVTWLVSSQAFLVTAFALSLNAPVQGRAGYDALNAMVVTSLPWAGVTISFVSYLTVISALLHMAEVRRLAPKLIGYPNVQGTWLRRGMGWSGPLILPGVFLLFWSLMLR